MRHLRGVGFALLIGGGLFAQVRGGFVNPRPFSQPFGSVVFPAGSNSMPGVTRTAGSVVFPGSGGIPIQPQVRPGVGFVNPGLGRPVTPGIPHRPGGGGGRPSRQNQSVIAYPVYVGGYYEPMAQPELAEAPQAAQAAPPNVIVVYPQQSAPMPVLSNRYGPDDRVQVYQAPPQPEATPAPPEPTHYLIAFNDHTVYAAVAYWVDGDTLHYFTAGNTHNQVSLSLVDRTLTERLNKDAGVEVKLPGKK